MAKFNEEYYKELEVPQFNKREVEGLSVAAVKKAIANGDIKFEDEDIVAKTLTQSEPTWEGDFTLTGHNGGDNYLANVTYSKASLVGNSLYVVVIVKCENTSNASISHPTPQFSKITLPDNIASKIYDLDGKNLTETPITTDCPITTNTRGARGSLFQWQNLYQDIEYKNSKLIRKSLKEMQIVAREALPTLDAGAVGYALLGFELVII